MTARRRTLSAILAVIVGLAAVEAATMSRQQADVFARKVVEIHGHGLQAKRRAKRTPISETELNSWFTYRAAPVMPTGLTQPQITIIGNGRLQAAATIDLDAIGKDKVAGGSIGVWNLLGGKLPLLITGVLHTKEGQGRFELQAAEISGVNVPKPLLQQLLSHYTKSPDKPQGYRLEDPFALPANIRQIDVTQGQAVVVQ